MCSAPLNPVVCEQAYFAPFFRSTWHPTSSCACQSFARSSCLVSLLYNAIYEHDLPFDQRPGVAKRKLPFLPSLLSQDHHHILLPRSRSLPSTLVFPLSQLYHTLFHIPTATQSLPKSEISISTPRFCRSFIYCIQETPHTIQDASLQLLQATPRASPERGEERGQPSPAQREEETLNSDRKPSPASQSCC